MTNLSLHREQSALIKPEPASRGRAITIHPATKYDLVFIDELMQQHAEMVGFASTTELMQYIDGGTALIARDGDRRHIGYCLYKDRYMKREDCGIVSQLVVSPRRHRGLVGAALVQAMFARLPYGVRLFCCWCAQDLQANHFWEALGFVPLAYRAGSRGKAQGGNRKEQRIHIFWERRVREEDEAGGYPYWYPSQTVGGRMGEARLALPIEPGTHWSDVKLVVLPGPPTSPATGSLAIEGGNDQKLLEAAGAGAGGADDGRVATAKRKSKPKVKAPPVPMSVTNGLRFSSPTSAPAEPVPEQQKVAEPKPKRKRHKNDPKLVAAAREFRDRYLEQVNAERGDQLLAWNGKYDVSRQLADASCEATAIEPIPLLHAA